MAGMLKKCSLVFFALALLAGTGWIFFRPAKTVYPYELGICAMFKNEAPWLKEWIVYHHDVLNAKKFWLYNNDSSDNFEEVLQPFIERGIVELIDWNTADESHHIKGVSDIDWYPCQLGAYNDCMKVRALGKAKWVAVLDIDEFLVPVHGVDSFYKMLADAEKRRKGTIKFSWRIFGTSDVWDLASNDLLTERMMHRAEDSHEWHNWCKSMHRPEAIEFCHIHDAPRIKEGYRRRHADPDEFRVHHYWTRTEKFCLQKRTKSKETDPSFFEQLNAVHDDAIAQYLPIIKKGI